jgi:hypothetical protein
MQHLSCCGLLFTCAIHYYLYRHRLSSRVLATTPPPKRPLEMRQDGEDKGEQRRVRVRVRGGGAVAVCIYACIVAHLYIYLIHIYAYKYTHIYIYIYVYIYTTHKHTSHNVPSFNL